MRRFLFVSFAVLVMIATVLFAWPDLRRLVLDLPTYAADVYNRHRPALNWRNGPSCLERLKKLEIVFRPASPATHGTCVVENPVIVSQVGAARFSSPAMVTCRMAELLAKYEPELQKEAQRELGRSVVRIDHLGSYNCRPIRGFARINSEHAYANALDISGFGLSGGARISLSSDWKSAGAEGRFLRAARQSACQIFPRVLSPEFDALHRDHFHLDAGLFSRCQ